MAKRISAAKRRHEAAKYFRQLVAAIYRYVDVIALFEEPTLTIDPDGTGRLYVPSRRVFERLTPLSPPCGMVFLTGSFLVVKEIFRFDAPRQADSLPQIVRIEFSYHYQDPNRRFFFRYDYHPQIGDPASHPPYHLHVGCWHSGEAKFPGVPRFPVPEVVLEEVIELIIRDLLGSE
jgi:hypothetical protein